MTMLHWITYSRRISPADLASLAHQAITGSHCYKKIGFPDDEWLSFFRTGNNFCRGMFVPPLHSAMSKPVQRRDELIRLFRESVELKEIASDQTLSCPELIIRSGWHSLSDAAVSGTPLDSRRSALLLAFIGTGIAHLYRIQYCEICFRISAAGSFRCRFHSRRKQPQQRSAEENSSLHDPRRASRILSQWGGMNGQFNGVPLAPIYDDQFLVFKRLTRRLPVHTTGQKSRSIANLFSLTEPQPQVFFCTNRINISQSATLGEVPDGSAPDNEWAHEIHAVPDLAHEAIKEFLPDILFRDRAIRKFSGNFWAEAAQSCPRVAQLLGPDINSLKTEKLVDRIRERLDPDNPGIEALFRSIWMGEEWLKLLEHGNSAMSRTSRTQQLLLQIRSAIAKGEKKAETAKKLGISSSNLSNLLKRHRKPAP